MANYGFVRVAAATPILKVADCDFNTNEILKLVKEAESKSVSAISFPEMCITGYTCGDLFLQNILLKEAEHSLHKICDETKHLSIIIIVGMPIVISGKIYNVAVAICNGKPYGIVPKTFLPNYGEFYEKRWFSSSKDLKEQTISLFGYEIPIGIDLVFGTNEFNFSIEICEDLWTPIPPSSISSLCGAEIIFNLSASNETIGKHTYRKSLVSQQSARCISGYIYSAAGNGESTTDLVFSGSSMIAENGSMLSESERFSFDSKMIISDIDIDRLKNDRLKNKSFTLSEYSILENIKYRRVDIVQHVLSKISDIERPIIKTPFVPTNDDKLNNRCSEIFLIQVGGLAKRMMHINCQKAIIGVSGGLDSTLALLVLAKVFDKLKIPRKNIIGITMPGFGTTGRTYNNALKLMEALGVTIKEIPINNAVIQHFKDIEHSIDIHDITYENSQARERTQILMDYANKENGLVIGTGDLSELALGWCTYNGDHMSMYALNSGIPKTLVRTMVAWISETQMDTFAKKVLDDIIDTPVSPELLPADENGNITQKTEDTVGPYILHDFFLYYMIRFGMSPSKIYFLAIHAFKDDFRNEEILEWLKVFYKRFFSQQFKRSCMPDGPKVGSINLSPRGDWRMPSDASVAVWMKDLEHILLNN